MASSTSTTEADSHGVRRGEILSAAVIVLSVALSMLAITGIWRVHTQTYDEPAHVATGLEFLRTGGYSLEPMHPPLARVAAASPLVLAGAKYPSTERRDIFHLGNVILHDGDYRSNLTLARIGVLPFFALLILATWRFCLRVAPGAEAIAVVLLCSSATVVAHAAIATTDAPMAALFVVACVAIWDYAGAPSALRAAVASVAAALAICTKFAALPYVAAVAVVLIVSRRSARAHAPLSVKRGVLHAGLVAVSGWLTVFLCYGASTSLLHGAGATMPALDWIRGYGGAMHREVVALASRGLLLPPELWVGLADFEARSRSGHPAMLLGMLSKEGWWYYFPVAVAVKTSLATLLGALLAVWLGVRRGIVQVLPTAAIVAGIFLVASRSKVNIGVRHVLPVYPLLCILAAAAMLWLWRTGGVWRRGVVVLGILAQLVSFAIVHPDHIAYFNVLAGRHPERVLTDSNIDWGQDLGRLSAELDRRAVGHVYISCFGHVFLDRFGLPRLSGLQPNQPVKGWVAISETMIADPHQGGHSFDWLKAHRPVTRIGRSIRLYYIE